MKTENYLLPDFWASALINDDATGLSDQEHIALNDWLLDVKPGHCIDVSDNPEFTDWHDARDYEVACTCLTYTFEKVAA